MYVANTAILELQIWGEDITSDCSFLLRLVETFTAHTEEYYLTCHKIGDAKTFKNLVSGTFVCSTIHFVLTSYMFIYCRLTHLTGVFKNMLIQCCILSVLIRRIYQVIFVRFFSFGKDLQTFKIKPISTYSQNHPRH